MSSSLLSYPGFYIVVISVGLCIAACACGRCCAVDESLWRLVAGCIWMAHGTLWVRCAEALGIRPWDSDGPLAWH